jgi:hypothetical protein
MSVSLAMSSLPKVHVDSEVGVCVDRHGLPDPQVLLELIAGRDMCRLGSRSAKLCLRGATVPR